MLVTPINDYQSLKKGSGTNSRNVVYNKYTTSDNAQYPTCNNDKRIIYCHEISGNTVNEHSILIT